MNVTEFTNKNVLVAIKILIKEKLI